MKELIFILCVIGSSPGFVVALALTALQHAIVTRNPLKIFWHFLRAFVWVVPVTFLTFILLVAVAFSPTIRPYGAIFLFLLNVAEVVIIFKRCGKPESVGGSFFHVAPILTALVCAWMVIDSPLIRSLQTSADNSDLSYAALY